MTTGQYRALVAYLVFWRPTLTGCCLELAMADIGITDGRDDVVSALWKAGWDYNEANQSLTYTLDE